MQNLRLEDVMSRMTPVLITWIILLTGCDSNPFAASRPSFLVATLTEEIEGEYAGTGEFTLGHFPSAPVANISSRGEPPRDNEYIYISVLGPRRAPHDPLTNFRPAVGPHPLSVVDLASWPADAAYAIYVRTNEDGSFDRFISADGELRITRSRFRRLEGNFSFTAMPFHQDGSISFGGPRLTVNGSFGADYVDVTTVTPSAPQ